MADNTDLRRTGLSQAYQALASVFALGFKFVALINGAGALLIVFCAMGIIESDLSSYLLRLPLTAFAAGLALCGVGLLWSYLVQTSLLTQLLTGRAGRTHWVPMFCALIAYSLSLVAFVLGCWFTVSLQAMVEGSAGYYSRSSEGHSASPSQQGVPAVPFTPDQRTKLVVFELA